MWSKIDKPYHYPENQQECIPCRLMNDICRFHRLTTKSSDLPDLK